MRLLSLTLITLFTLTAAIGQVVITEIMYNPPESGQDFHEFIEIYNPGADAVDMTGYSFASGVTYTFEAFSLGAGEYVIVAGNSDAMATDLGITALQWTSGSLSNGGETIQLVDAAANVVDEVTYDDGGDWSDLADGPGASLVLCDFAADNDIGTNWAAANTATGFIVDGLETYATPGTTVACASGPMLQFVEEGTEVSEDAGTASFRIAISGADLLIATHTINITMASASTVSVPADVTFTPASTTFSSNVSADTMTVTMTIVDDADVESLENLVLELTSPSAGVTVLGPKSKATLSILDNDSEVADIVINEIMYNTPGADDYEFLELYNNGSSTVNLAGYYFELGITKVLPDMDMMPGEFLVISIDSVAFETEFGVASLQWTSGGLGNGGETIELRDASGNVVDVVEYDDGGDWPTEPDGAGNTLILCDPSSDNNLASSWIAATQSFDVFLSGVEIFGSPGAANDCSPPQEVEYTAYPIGQVSTVNADGVVDSLGVKVELTGVVHGVDLQAAGHLFTIIDSDNNGIAIFNSGDEFGYTVTEGDEITVQGSVSQYNGLAQIGSDSVWMNSAGNTLQTALDVTALDETTESQLVRIVGATITNAVVAGGGLNVTLEVGADTYLMRADFDTDLTEVFVNDLGSQVINVTGIGGQFDSSSPYDDGYQILPRYQADIEIVTSVNEPVWASSIRLFPVPTSEKLTLESGVMVESVSVINALGQVISKELVDANQFELNVNALPKGVYHLEISSQNERVLRKFVKQ